MTVDPYCYFVASPILHPVVARTGDVIVVRPGHATRPIVVVREIKGEWEPVYVGPPNYGAILVREDDGFLIQMTPAALALAKHPLVRSA